MSNRLTVGGFVLAALFSIILPFALHAQEAVPADTSAATTETVDPVSSEMSSPTEAPPAEPATVIVETPAVIETAPVEPATPPTDIVEAPPAAPETIPTDETSSAPTQENAPNSDAPASDATTSADAPTSADSLLVTDSTTAQIAAAALTLPSPVLTTDKDDYHPGEFVTVFGKFFSSLQNVILVIVGTLEDGSQITDSWTASADSEGSFTTGYTLQNLYVPNYLLAANATTGELLATTEFTDSISVNSVSVGTQSPKPVQAGSAATYNPVNINFTGSGGSCSANMSITGLPAGAVATFTPSSIPSTSPSGTLSISTTNGTTPVGTTTITINATPSAGCGSATVRTTNTTIIVSAVKTNPNLSVTNSPQPFTGAAIAATVTGDVAGVVSDVKYNGSATVPTAAGTYAVTADFVPTNSSLYTSLNDASAGNFVISPAASVTAVTCPASVAYNGSAQAPCSVSVTGAGGLSLTPAPVYSNNTNAGTANASYTFTGDANHTSSNDSENFSISQVSSVTVVSCPTNVAYTGSALTPCTANVTGIGGLNQSVAVVHSNNTNAGLASANATFAGDTNHTGSSDSENFTIDQATSATVITCPVSAIYTGSAITPCSAAVTGAGGLSTTATVLYANNTSVGTATADASYAGDTNHSASNATQKTFDITKADTTTVISCPISPTTYTGAAIEPCTASVTGAGLSTTVAVAYDNNVDVGTATAHASFAGDANHNASVATDATFDISQAASVTVVSCAAGPFIYNASAHTPCSVSVTGAGGLNLTPAANYSDNTDAGLASASYTFAGDTNHSGSSDAENFTIGQAISTTVVTCPASVTFTGSVQTPCTASVTGAGGLNQSLFVDYVGDLTNAGSVVANATFAGDPNHTGSNDSDGFSILPAMSTTLVSCPVSVVFNSTAQTPCSVSVTGAGGLNLTPAASYSNNTNVGTADASFNFLGDANHSASSDAKNFAITPAVSVVIVSCPASVGYTGSAQTPCTANVTGVGGLNETVAVDHTNNTDAGTANASAAYAGDANHSGDTDATTFEITKAASVTGIICPVSVVYTGVAQTPCTASVTGAGGLNEAVLVLHTNNIDAGTANTEATYAGDDNHEGSSDAETFTITQAASATVVTCPTNVTYTGLALTPCTVAVTGAGGLNLSPNADYIANTDAGTATASYDFAGDTNHTASSDSKDFTIDQAASMTTVTCPLSATYTGASLTPCTASVTGVGGLNLAPTPNYTNNTIVGTASADYSYVGDANHTSSSDSENFEITKADSATLVTCPVSVVYNGSAQEACTASVTGAGGLNQSLTVGYTDNTNAGTASANATFAGDANHNGSSDSETFEIQKASSATLITCPANVTYTGAALTPCSATATGAGGLNATVTVNYASNTDAGTANADATFGGDTNHEGSSDTETFVIDQATSSTVVSCPANVTYTGAALTPCSTAVTGANLNLTPAPTYANNTDAGIANASYNFAGDANHTGSSDSENFTIDQAASVTTVTCPVAQQAYTGSAQTPCSANVTGAGGLSQALPVNYSNNTFAGTATATSSYAGDTNHTASNDSETFSISAVTLTVYASTTISKQYSDAIPPLNDVTFSGFVGGDDASDLGGSLSCITTATVLSPAATYPITCSGYTSANYTIGYVQGTLTVVQEKTAIDDQTEDFYVTAGPTIANAPVQLNAHLTEQSDGFAGDLTKAKVNFVLTPIGGGGTVTIPNVSVNASGDASITQNINVGTYNLSVVIATPNSYWTQDPAGASTLEVTPGSTEQRVTGGGWVGDSASRNGKDNFGFTVYYNKNGAPKGNFLFMFRGTDGFDYQIKSNSWAKGGLSFTGVNGALFSGKATWSKIDQLTGLVVESDGSYTFDVNLKDGGLVTPKITDQAGFVIKGANGGIWKSVPITNLGGGNVTVQSK